jgi:hypothetical protein
MVNVWMRITTEDQLRNAPVATELTVTAQTVEEAMMEIRKWESLPENQRWLHKEDIDEIEKASLQLRDAQDSVYEVR